MSWEEIQPASKAASASSPVRIGVRQIRNSPARCILLIRGEVLDRLGGTKRRYRLAFGNSDDTRHQLRIAQDDDGLFEATEPALKRAKGNFRIVLPPHDRFPECKVKPEACTFAQEDGALIVDLPLWGFDEEARRRIEESAGVR